MAINVENRLVYV